MKRSVSLGLLMSCVFSLADARTAYAQTCGTNADISACTQGQNSGTGGSSNPMQDLTYAVWGGDVSTGDGNVGVGGSSYNGIGTSGLTSSSVWSGVLGVSTSEANIEPSNGLTDLIGSDISSNYLPAGVFGWTNENGISGVAGYAASNGAGVYGVSASGNGVEGLISSSNGNSAVAGINGGTGNGVFGKIDGSSTTATLAAISGDDATGLGSSYTNHWAGYFNGNVEVTNGNSYYYNGTGTCVGGRCPSDRRLKKDIAPLSGALDRLLKLKGVTFKWIKPEEHGNQAGTQTGFVAQEVKAVLPAWVDEDKSGTLGIVLPPLELAALQVEAIRTQQEEIEALKAQVRALANGERPNLGSPPSFNFNGVGWGAAGILGTLLMVSRRKRTQPSA